MAVLTIGFLMRLPDAPVLTEIGTALMICGAVAQGVFFFWLGGSMSSKRWNETPEQRRARHRRTLETSPRDADRPG